MDLSRFNIGLKKWLIIGCIVILILLSLLMYTYMNKSKEQKNTIEKSAKELEMLIVEAEQNEPGIEKMMKFIYNRVPYKHDLLDVQVNTVLEKELNDMNDVKKSNEEELTLLSAQLLKGLKQNNVSQVLGTFKISSYENYLNQHVFPDEKEESLLVFVQTLNRNNLLVDLGIIMDDGRNKDMKMVFRYSDGIEVEVSLQYTTIRDMHKSSKSNEYVFDTPFEVILKSFDKI
ncbi:hypothetical protein ACIQYL_20845 [Lysinibacillus xylanilyticus]|uniref:hypothetical protein n=1 Tax=Lysinibacillus xylanilyticus TaxID=582475 RepID=UPI0038030199